MFKCGELTRAELHAAMAEHAMRIIGEIEEVRRNPVAAYIEGLRNRRAASRLARRHGEAYLRGVLLALSEAPDFPPAAYLWNAWHWDVPLHCFIRMRHEPVFRVLRLDSKRMSARIIVEHGHNKGRNGTKPKRESFTLRRGWDGWMNIESRRVIE